MDRRKSEASHDLRLILRLKQLERHVANIALTVGLMVITNLEIQTRAPGSKEGQGKRSGFNIDDRESR